MQTSSSLSFDLYPPALHYFRVFCCWSPSRMWIVYERFPANFQVSLPKSNFGFTNWILSESLLKLSNNFRGKCLSLKQSMTHIRWEGDGHTIHKQIHWRLIVNWQVHISMRDHVCTIKSTVLLLRKIKVKQTVLGLF